MQLARFHIFDQNAKIVLASAFFEYGGPEVLRWAEVDDPVLGPEDALIEVHACGLNHVDLDSRAGTSPWQFDLPHVLGGEFAGVIAEVGSNVRDWTPGQVVTAQHQYSCGECFACLSWRSDLCPNYKMIGTDTWGAYAEFVRVPARLLIELESLDQAVTAASCFCVVSTAWHMVTKLADIRPGECVLVPSASGGVGSSLVQCAKLAGARVIASAGNAEKAERVRALGADEVFVHADTPPSQAVAELTKGVGVDAVLDTTGGPLFDEHLKSLRRDGRLALCGAHAGETTEVDLIDVFVRGLRILGFRLASPADIRTALRLVLDGTVEVPIARTFPLSEASQAQEFLDRREHVGKVVLVR
jgi:NADPH:quinone reductase-like Zn-dependent oxidoreductase